MEIRKVGVVGCGQMGAGIVQVCAQAGFQVVASEINDKLLNKGLTLIDSVLTRSVDKGRLSQQDKEAILSRIKGTTDTQNFHDCDLVVEAAIENMDLKKKIFAELDKICSEQAILATNTSCLSIIEIAMATKKPDKVLGLHFFNPVPVMKLLEIVTTVATSNDTLEAVKAFGKSLDKTIVIAQDTPGFIVNRLLIPYLLDAISLLEAGVATKGDIDASMTLGLNHPMGPLALSDFIGLDTVLFIANAMYEEFKDSKCAPPPILKKMVTAGWLGRKTGKGFYDYN